MNEWKLIINSKEMEVKDLVEAWEKIDEALNEAGIIYEDIENDIIQNPRDGGCYYNGEISFELVSLI